MPQSLVKNSVYIIFSTKNRHPFIDDEIKDELFRYIGGICKNLECHPIIVGGYKDHVHLLCMLSRKVALMKQVEKIKAYSSKWIKSKGPKYQKFYWQNGYGTFSVYPSQIETVKNYIHNQLEHHKNKPFKDEYLSFLKEHDAVYDEQYLWD